jgi:hypothetical protein
MLRFQLVFELQCRLNSVPLGSVCHCSIVFLLLLFNGLNASVSFVCNTLIVFLLSMHRTEAEWMVFYMCFNVSVSSLSNQRRHIFLCKIVGGFSKFVCCIYVKKDHLLFS